MVVSSFSSNDLDNYALLDHTHSNYVTSDQISTIVNSSIQNGEIAMSSSMIRKITRGTSSGKGDVTISCSITDTNKVIVLLDADSVGYINSASGVGISGGSIYLKSVSNSNIIVNAKGPDLNSSNKYTTKTITFSYQIIEFM